MQIVTDGILMVAAVSLTVGAIQLRLCFQPQNRRTHILFVAASFGVASYALIERALMLASTPAEQMTLFYWIHLPVTLVVVAVAWFVHFYLNAGRVWLLWLFTIVRAASLALNFGSSTNLNYLDITEINRVNILGEPLSVTVGVPNPLMLVGQAALALFVIFVIDAVIEAWRLGDRLRAKSIGAAVIIFSVSALAVAVSVFWGYAQLPLFASPFFLLIVIVMGFELTRDVRRAAELVDDLKQSEAALRESHGQLDLSAGAADVGIWACRIGDQTITASTKWRELFEFDPSLPITFDEYLRRIHPDDRERVEKALGSVMKDGGGYETEYRLLLHDGGIRWIGSRGRVEIAEGKPHLLRGASVDITKLKLAEQDAHKLSRKLMGAQEKERARLAREFHDDLGQSLALLSIQLQMLGRESEASESMRSRIDELKVQIQRLSSDVHRISHELHPAKLTQLGLESALRGFCREIGELHGVKVTLEASDVPRIISNDISLCVYRITQESLQNVVKHSGASLVNVSLSADAGEIRLLVTDNGHGFDPEAAKSKESLGLVSMHERILAVNGSFTLESVQGSGTRIEACIPLPTI